MLVMRIAPLPPPGCEHAPSDNPRYKGSCRKCGRVLPVLARDREFEREATQRIAGDMVDVAALNSMAERRADSAQAEYGHDFPDLDRDLEREACEELADCRNYIIWRLDGLRRDLYEDDDSDRIAELSVALRSVALAFGAVRRAMR